MRAALVVLACASCYRPELRDCTVSCTAATDCAAGQVCSQNWCTAPQLAGTCGSDGPVDPDGFVDPDGPPGPDSTVHTDGSPDAEPDAPPPPPPDASTGPDASALLNLLVHGRGRVTVQPIGVQCDGRHNQTVQCPFTVMPNAFLSLSAIETHPSSDFQFWSLSCSGSGACNVTMNQPVVSVRADFSN